MKDHLAQRWFHREGKTSAEQMRDLLAQCRRDGLDFPQAWAISMSRVRFENGRQQIDWLLAWNEPAIFEAWRASYERRDHAGARAVAAISGMHEAVAFARTEAINTFGGESRGPSRSHDRR